MQTGSENQLLAEGMFNFLNELRDDIGNFITKYVTIPWAETEITENWNPAADFYNPLVWNEALARAG